MSFFASFLLDSVNPRASCNFTNDNETLVEASSSSASSLVEGITGNSGGSISRESLEDMLAAPPPSNNNESGGVSVGCGSVVMQSETEDESSYAGQTILSSAPSDTILNIERLGQTDNNPWPRHRAAAAGDVAAHPLSVSTAASCYIDLDSQDQDQVMHPVNIPNSVANTIPRQDSFDSLSFHASGMDSSIAISDTNEEGTRDSSSVVPHIQQRQQQEQQCHNRVTNMASFPSLEAYQSALPLQSTTIVMPHRNNTGDPIHSRRIQDWCSNLNLKDLDNLRQRRARLAGKPFTNVATTHTPLRRPLQQLPPVPSVPNEEGDDAVVAATNPTLSLQDIGVPTSLPGCFICPICRSAIVGALTLDCDCGTTVCSSCWEYRAAASKTKPDSAAAATASTTQHGGGEEQKEEEDAFALARGLDYEIVDRGSVGFRLGCRKQVAKCPCCHGAVHNPVYCHALDVAILQIVQGLSNEFRKFQVLYYERLRNWREEVIRRQQEEAARDDACSLSDEAIAQLIHQEEEEEFWKQQQQAATQAKAKKPILIPVATAAGAIGFVFAIMASVGIRLLTQRRIDSHSIRNTAANAYGKGK